MATSVINMYMDSEVSCQNFPTLIMNRYDLHYVRLSQQVTAKLM